MHYTARIYQPAKNAMQSGKRHATWVLEFAPNADVRFVEPLMGWTGSTDTAGAQIRLRFSTKEEAIQYAEKHNISYEVAPPKTKVIGPKSYASNFRHDRVDAWSSS